MADQKTRNPVLVSALMEKANQDPMLRARLLTEPEAVAAEFKISFEPKELEYLKKVGEFFRLSDDLGSYHFDPDWIRYPIDVWRSRKLIELITKARFFPRPFPGYPVDYRRFREIFRTEIPSAEILPAKTQF
jgi:hypothetical protein